MKASLKKYFFRTYSPNQKDLQAQQWFLVDVKDQVLGKVASKIADLLRGKTKPGFSNHLDTGDFIIVINADKVRVTGKKEIQKTYHTHSRFPGGLKTITVKEAREKKPEMIITHAVAGMIKNTKLKKHYLKKLKVFAGKNHEHAAQTPITIEL